MTRETGWRRALILAGGVVAIDQASKGWIVANRALGETDSIFFGLELNHVRNDGVAFGALAGGGALIWVLTTVAVAALLLYFAVKAGTRWLWLPVGAIAGGALGNLVDRAREGAVIDFIDPVAWPAFNFADIAIVVGILGFMWVLEGPGDDKRVTGDG